MGTSFILSLIRNTCNCQYGYALWVKLMSSHLAFSLKLQPASRFLSYIGWEVQAQHAGHFHICQEVYTQVHVILNADYVIWACDKRTLFLTARSLLSVATIFGSFSTYKTVQIKTIMFGVSQRELTQRGRYYDHKVRGARNFECTVEPCTYTMVR